MKTYLRGIIFVLLALLLIFGAWTYINKYKKSSKASGAFAVISLVSQKRSVIPYEGKGTVTFLVSGKGRKISGVDITFETQGDDNLDLTDTHIVSGADRIAVSQTKGTALREDNTKRIRRVVVVAKRSVQELNTTMEFSVDYHVKKRGSTGISTIKASRIIVVGPYTPGDMLNAETNDGYPLEFTVDSRSPESITPQDCRAKMTQELTCASSCKNYIELKWNYEATAERYLLFKDDEKIPFQTLLGRQSYSFVPPDSAVHSYRVIAENKCGSQSTTLPVVQCRSFNCGGENPLPSPTQTAQLPSLSSPQTDCAAEVPEDLTCSSTCGSNVILKWKDVANEDGYRIYKDNLTSPIATLGKNQTAYVYPWCGDLSDHAYTLVAYNAACGSRSTTQPKVQCACDKCVDRGPSPTQGAIQPVNTADIILKLAFPDAASNVQKISNVKIEVQNGAAPACAGCSQTVAFTRVGSYFVSPQLSFRLEQTLPYTLNVKQAATVGRSYRYVYLQKNRLLNCSIGFDSACGQLLSEIDNRPMFSGDTNGFDTQSEGYNVIDNNDMSAVTAAVSAKSVQGDMNFDGKSDTVDIGIVGKNFGQKGDSL